MDRKVRGRAISTFYESLIEFLGGFLKTYCHYLSDGIPDLQHVVAHVVTTHFVQAREFLIENKRTHDHVWDMVIRSFFRILLLNKLCKCELCVMFRLNQY